MNSVNTREVKDRLRREGKTIKEWAEECGVNDYALVRRLMGGFCKGTRGKSHDAAVALGLKADPQEFVRRAA